MLRQRYVRILSFFASVLLRVGWWDVLLPRLGLRALSRRTRPERLRKMAASFRALAVQMGGVMIKVGQFLSARLDVLPREVTDELSGLQDEVRAEDFQDICDVIESEFHTPLNDLFLDFQPVPMASASIGQVHFARIRPDNSGEEAGPMVVVKVQRPMIEQIVATDLSALRVVGGWLDAYQPIRRRANIPALLAEFSRTLYEEIDYLNEGKNAERFAENFKDRPEVCVPAVYWNRTTRRVLTLENVLAIKITDYPAIEGSGVDRVDVANRLFNVYLQQIFEDRFFHADPHPGNLFILPTGDYTPGQKRTWKLVFVDFGMAGTIPPSMLDALRELFIAVGTQDASRVIHAYQMMGVLLPGADVEQLERATAMVFERFWGKSTQEMVQMGHQEAMTFVREFSDLMYEMPFQVPENLILLGRSLAILSGICTGLDPDFNLWTTAAPYAEQLIASEGGRNIQFILREVGDIASALASLPRKTRSLLDRMEQGRLEVRLPQVTEQLERIDRSIRRLGTVLVFGVFFFGAIQLFLVSQPLPAALSAFFALVSLFFVLR